MLKEQIIFNDTVGNIADTTSVDVDLSSGAVPATLYATGLQTGESIDIYLKPFDTGTFSALVDTDPVQLTPTNNAYIITAPGYYRFQFEGNADAANAATLQVGLTIS